MIRTARSLCLLALVSVGGAAGCAVDDPEAELTEVAHGCSTCETNGLPPAALAAARFELAPGPMTAAGLRMGPQMRALCGAAPVAGTCTLASDWMTWATTAATPAMRETRFALIKYMIKVGAPKGIAVIIPTSPSPWAALGGFGLAPSVVSSWWGSQAQALVTAGMAALADFNANGVEVCLKTALTPDCPASYSWHEIAVIGNWFEGRPELGVGGYEAELPDDSLRVCPGYGTGCTTFAAKAPYHAARCVYVGPASQRHPISCTATPGGPAFGDAVQVFLPNDPKVPGAVPFGPPRL